MPIDGSWPLGSGQCWADSFVNHFFFVACFCVVMAGAGACCVNKRVAFLCHVSCVMCHDIASPHSIVNPIWHLLGVTIFTMVQILDEI